MQRKTNYNFVHFIKERCPGIHILLHVINLLKIALVIFKK